MEQRILKLEKEINELLQWKTEFEKKQFQKPVGVITKSILNKNRMVKLRKQLLNPTFNLSLEMEFKKIRFWVSASTMVN
jgi:hypothetical protein